MKLLMIFVAFQLAYAAASAIASPLEEPAEPVDTEPYRAAGIVKRDNGCGCGGDRAVFDYRCRNGGLGCNACGQKYCRFCGFGVYRRC